MVGAALIGHPLCELIATNLETFCIAGIVGLMVPYMAYGFTGMIGGVMVIFLLWLRTERWALM